MDKRTEEQTNGWKISLFYRTLSPIGAAAQKGDFTETRYFYKPNFKKKNFPVAVWTLREFGIISCPIALLP